MSAQYRKTTIGNVPTRVYSAVGGAFMAALRDTHNAYPPAIRSFFEHARFENGKRLHIRTARLHTDTRDDEARRTPDKKDDKRTHFNHVSGRFSGRDGALHVFEFTLRQYPGIPIETMDMMDAQDPSENPHVWFKTAVADVYRHEGGHSVSSLLGRLGEQPGFIEAWKADVAALGGEDAARKKRWGYFIQDGAQGREEVIADLWAERAGSPKQLRPVSAAFPHCEVWFSKFYDRFVDHLETDPALLQREEFIRAL